MFETSGMQCTLPTFMWEKYNIYECGGYHIHVMVWSPCGADVLLLAIILPIIGAGEFCL